MKLGYIGLGKMGHNMVERLLEKGHEVFVFDTSEDARVSAEKVGAKSADSIKALVDSLKPPRTMWIMVPHGVVDGVLEELVTILDRGDTIIDGGNSFYKDSMRRANDLAEKEIRFLDAGVSGGPQGAKNGACIMVGGNEEDYKSLEPLFRDLTLDDGYAHVGRHGAGHFVKMVHNGIEYGMMQAISEGFGIMRESEFDLDLKKIAALYSHGSVVESRLVGWLHDSFEEFGQEMKGVSGSVAQSGEGAWTSDTARELNIPSPVIDDAVKFRLDSQKNPSYIGKLLSAMRNRFGGHEVRD